MASIEENILIGIAMKCFHEDLGLNAWLVNNVTEMFFVFFLQRGVLVLVMTNKKTQSGLPTRKSKTRVLSNIGGSL